MRQNNQLVFNAVFSTVIRTLDPTKSGFKVNSEFFCNAQRMPLPKPRLPYMGIKNLVNNRLEFLGTNVGREDKTEF